MVIIYLHGFRSVANSGKTLTLREMFPEHQVIGPSYAPHDPALAEKTLIGLINSLDKKQQILVIGTSLGGFWAHWMAKRFSLTAIMINPSLDPANTLAADVYTLYDETNTQIEVTDANLKSFVQYKVNSQQAKELNCFVWVSLDDEVLHAQTIIDELGPLHRMSIYQQGGHRFAQFDQMKKEIESIINKL